MLSRDVNEGKDEMIAIQSCRKIVHYKQRSLLEVIRPRRKKYTEMAYCGVTRQPKIADRPLSPRCFDRKSGGLVSKQNNRSDSYINTYPK